MHIHVLLDILIHVVAYLEPCVTLGYSETCHIQNCAIFKTQDIFRTQSRHILSYSEHCVMLAYRAPCHLELYHIHRVLVYFRCQIYLELYQISKME